MTCDCCTTARENPLFNRYSPACLWCGARLIQVLGKLARPREEIAQRRRAVLADWIQYGHLESDLRQLAKGPVPLEPESSDAPKKSGR